MRGACQNRFSIKLLFLPTQNKKESIIYTWLKLKPVTYIKWNIIIITWDI